jgi:hypothetical protein
VVGAGWIGAEVAASARQLDVDVTLIERAEVPLEAVLGREVGAIYADVHREHDVELLAGAATEGFEGDRRVEAVRIADGDPVACDLVVVGIGVVPRTGLAEAAGIEIDNGALAADGPEHSRAWLGASSGLLVVGALFWSWSVYGRARRPREFAWGELPGWPFAVYVWLTLAGLLLLGAGLLLGDGPGWAGWLTVGAGVLFLAGFVRFGDLPPFVFYVVLTVVGVAVL